MALHALGQHQCALSNERRELGANVSSGRGATRKARRLDDGRAEMAVPESARRSGWNARMADVDILFRSQFVRDVAHQQSAVEFSGPRRETLRVFEEARLYACDVKGLHFPCPRAQRQLVKSPRGVRLQSSPALRVQKIRTRYRLS